VFGLNQNFPAKREVLFSCFAFSEGAGADDFGRSLLLFDGAHECCPRKKLASYVL
jgi:hypothetical protein